jgi:hypothetical protein
MNGEEKELTKIRPDLNLEKWPALWQPSKSRVVKHEKKIFHREVTLKDGSRSTATLEILPDIENGPLNTRDQQVFYALILLWEEKGRPAKKTTFSMRRLAKVLDMDWGSSTRRALEESILKLNTTTLRWKSAYFNAAQDEIEQNLKSFHILTEIDVTTKKKKSTGVLLQESYSVVFNDLIISNILNNYTKPVFLDVIIGFKSDIAQLLYNHVDLILANTYNYERNTEDLFKDLGLEGTSYTNPQKRRQSLTKPMKELLGIPLTNGGFITAAKIEKMASGKDFKVVFQKGSNKKEINEEHIKSLISIFHQLQFGADSPRPLPKELEQAETLAREYGLEKAEFIVRYAINEAPKTHFQMKTFGAVLTYINEALASFDKEQIRLEEERKRKETADLELLKQNHRRERREEYQSYLLTKFEEAKTHNPLYAQALNDIKADILREYAPYLKDREDKDLFYNQMEDLFVERIKGILPEFPIDTFWDWDYEQGKQRFKVKSSSRIKGIKG